MPPNARQSGQFPFTNNCPTNQVFKVSAEPPADWLRYEPPLVLVGAGMAFGVTVTANTAGNRAAGTYRTALKVVCASCAGSDPPCLQDARDFAVHLTVANVRAPGQFEPMATPTRAAPAPKAAPEKLLPVVTEAEPGRPAFERYAVPVGGGLLAAGAIGVVAAMRGLAERRTARNAGGQSGAESERHQVRR